MSDGLLNIQITGQLPKIESDLTPAMERIAQRLAWSIGQAHENEGYGTWSPTREGRPATLSGIRKTERTSFGSDFAEIRFKNTIHQRGGMYKATDRQRRFLFATHPEWRNGSGATGQGMWLKFPPRPLTLQKEDIDYFKQELLNRIFSIRETVQ